MNIKTKQLLNIASMTFWSMFASYTFAGILIVFLTMPVAQSGLGLNDHDAYMLYGVVQAMGYILPVVGGYLADKVLGVRRAMSYGACILAFGFLALVISTHAFTGNMRQAFFLAYALVPLGSSLYMGTASALIGRIFKDDEHSSKRAMTVYYITINVGSMLGIGLAPYLLHSSFGPMSVFLVAFVGKFIAWLNFALRRKLYDDVMHGEDAMPIGMKKLGILVLYCAVAYFVTCFLFSHAHLSFYLIGAAIVVTLLVYLLKTLNLSGEIRSKQMLSIYLLLAVFAFFVLYAQMNTSLILFTKNNSDHKLLGFTLYPASFQLINPIAIILIGSFISKIYKRFPQFNIPYQFSAGLLLGALGIFFLYLSGFSEHNGLVSGNFVGLAYFTLTISELLISAIGLSMISLYCEMEMMAFAMGVFYLVVSLANLVSGKLSDFVALPEKKVAPQLTLPIYTHFYSYLALASLIFGVLFFAASHRFNKRFARRGIALP
ncbi:peptide MFS transporter [Gallaecimonas mangrovi]|uniref:peptide MFS transporter n=1 Tax=Gallaecimonas mangrovi TaxID=2291597 RepID=UPI000E20AEC6|nr:oligopeptide:H+ symporter [Gallaecimonas mangrovi]